MKKIFLTASLVFYVTNINAQTKYRSIDDATSNLRLAMLNGNKELLNNLVDGSLSYGHSSGKIEDRTSFIESLSSGKSDFVNLEISNQIINQYRNSAVVRHTLQGDTNDNGVAGKVKLHVMQVWIKKNGSWKLVGRQAVKI